LNEIMPKEEKKLKQKKLVTKQSGKTPRKKTVRKVAAKTERKEETLKVAAESVLKKTGESTEGKAMVTVPKYFEAVGRRKTSIARARLFTRGEKGFFVNGKSLEVYFPTAELCQIADAALNRMHCEDKFRVELRVKGGGIHSQAEAVRHAISRGLVLFNPDFRKRLKRAGFLTRDSRMRERKKFGLKRARRAPQWQKR